MQESNCVLKQGRTSGSGGCRSTYFSCSEKPRGSRCLRADLSLGVQRAAPGLAQVAWWARENWNKSGVLMVLSDLECCQVKYLYITTNPSKALGQRPVQTAPLLAWRCPCGAQGGAEPPKNSAGDQGSSLPEPASQHSMIYASQRAFQLHAREAFCTGG